jgi:hypothetical protein
MAIKLDVPLINGVAYVHADIVVNIFGAPIIGVTAITYGDPQQITPNYSTGNLPTSAGFGPVEPTATITLTMEEVTRLQTLAPGNKLQNIKWFDVGVNFLPKDGILIRHRLVKCRFKGVNISSETNNSQIEVPLELFVSDIQYIIPR